MPVNSFISSQMASIAGRDCQFTSRRGEVPPNAFRIPGFSAPTQIGTGARPSGRITVRICLVFRATSGRDRDCATRKRRKRRAPFARTATALLTASIARLNLLMFFIRLFFLPVFVFNGSGLAGTQFNRSVPSTLPGAPGT